MGHRLSKITTRTGDAGETGLGDGTRVGKDHARVTAMGDVDELNSTLGLLLTEDLSDALRAELLTIQHDLFDLGGELSIPGYEMVKEAQVERLEALTEKLNAELAPLKEFILPGGTRSASIAHVARTVCRRAERSVVALMHADPKPGAVTDAARVYLNRLSDLMFVLARTLNRVDGSGDVLWQKGRAR